MGGDDPIDTITHCPLFGQCRSQVPYDPIIDIADEEAGDLWDLVYDLVQDYYSTQVLGVAGRARVQGTRIQHPSARFGHGSIAAGGLLVFTQLPANGCAWPKNIASCQQKQSCSWGTPNEMLLAVARHVAISNTLNYTLRPSVLVVWYAIYPYTLHGTGIYATPLTPLTHHPNVCKYGSLMEHLGSMNSYSNKGLEVASHARFAPNSFPPAAAR